MTLAPLPAVCAVVEVEHRRGQCSRAREPPVRAFPVGDGRCEQLADHAVRGLALQLSARCAEHAEVSIGFGPGRRKERRLADARRSLDHHVAAIAHLDVVEGGANDLQLAAALKQTGHQRQPT